MYKLTQLLAHEVCVYERLCSMTTTVDLGNVIGPQGPMGVQGPQGPKGETGPAGANWYILELEYDVSTSKLEPRSHNSIRDAIQAIPYVICTVTYGKLNTTFVPTAFYRLYDKSVSNYCQYIQFSCLTLKDTAKDANTTIADYYNCIVVGEDDTVTGYVRDVDPAANWDNIQNKPFSSVDTSSGVLHVDKTGKISCAIDTINPLVTGNPAITYDNSALAIGPAASANSSKDIAIGSSANTTTHNQHNTSGDNIAIGTNAACTNTAQSAIAIGRNADCRSSHSVALGERSISTNAYEVSVGNTNEQRRICFVDNPSNDYDAVNLIYFENRVPVTVMLCSNVSTSTAALDTNKTFAGFSNMTLSSSAYNLMYTYIKLKNFTPDCIIFQAQGTTQTPTKQQVFTVSQSQNIYMSNVLNLNILADCFVNFGMITNASSTMLNLARVELSMTSKTEIMMNVSSASAMGIDKNSTYAMYLQLRPASSSA